MADLTITAGNVRQVSQNDLVRCTAGEAITQGQAYWRDPSDGKCYLADADDTANDELAGIAMTPADADGGTFYGQETVGAQIDIGATTTRGEIYVVSGTPGGIAPEADLAGTDKVLVVGVAVDTAGTLDLALFNSTATLS